MTEVQEIDSEYGSSIFLYYFSIFIGYTYAACWGISFLGCNLDFVIYNISGFAFYTGYNLAGYFYPKQSGIVAEGNDLAFALWSFAMTIIIGIQCFVLYPRGSNKVSPLCVVVTWIQWGIVVGHYLGYMFFELYEISNVYENIWYVMSYLKLFITVTKYIPQAWWNYIRKSTKGWSACGVILDFWGGILCSFQILLEYYNGENSQFGGEGTGFNVAKFGLSWISIAFDTLFLIQHFVLYRKNRGNDEEKQQLNEQQDIQQPQQQIEQQQQEEGGINDNCDSAKDVQIYIHKQQKDIEMSQVSNASTACSVNKLNNNNKNNNSNGKKKKNYDTLNEEEQQPQQ